MLQNMKGMVLNLRRQLPAVPGAEEEEGQIYDGKIRSGGLSKV